jgi:hypothetical protein
VQVWGRDRSEETVDEVLSQGFPCVTPVLRFKVKGSGKPEDSPGS